MSMRTRYARASAFVNVRLSGWKSFSQIRHRCMTKQQRNLLRAGRQTAIRDQQVRQRRHESAARKIDEFRRNSVHEIERRGNTSPDRSCSHRADPVHATGIA